MSSSAARGVARDVDVICDAFEAAWKLECRPQLEDYLTIETSQLEVLIRELVHLDVYYRNQFGEAVAFEDYADYIQKLVRQRQSSGDRPTTALPMSNTRAPADLFEIESNLDCRFTLLERLGQGGGGAVWRAHDARLQRIVAVKVPHPMLVGARESLERFAREARVAARLRHPGIVAVHEVTTLNGMPALIEDYVAGSTLGALLAKRRFSPRAAAALAADIADALEYAHSQGAIHRDIKPSNIMVGLDAKQAPVRPMIIDFGLALHGDSDLWLTAEGDVIGTPAYMSPEQAAGQGHTVDRRTDVYSLGVVLYEMLTGELPFRGTRTMLLHQVLHDEPPPPRQLSLDVPRDLNTIGLKCLSKLPRHRYETAGELAADLRRFLAGEPVRARPVSRLGRGLRWARRRPTAAALWGVSAVGALALVGAAVGLFYNARLQEANARLLQSFDESSEAHRREAQERRRAEANLYFRNLALASREWEANNVGRVQQLLAQCPIDARGWEWHYLSRLTQPRERTLPHLSKSPNSFSVVDVAYHPGGRQLASASRDGLIRIWNEDTGAEPTILGGPTGQCVNKLSYSRDGRWLAAAVSNGIVRLWDARSLKAAACFRCRGPAASAVAFSPDGRCIAAASGPALDTHWSQDISPKGVQVQVWNLADGREVQVLHDFDEGITALSYSPDGHYLATATGRWNAGWPDVQRHAGRCSLWELDSGRVTATFRGHEAPITGVVFSPDGTRLATSSWDRTVKVWNAATQAELLTLRGHLDWVRGIAYSPDGNQLASASVDDSIRVWDAYSGQELFVLRGHTHAVNAVAFHPAGGALASASSDQTVKIWDIARDPQGIAFCQGAGPVTQIVFSDQHLITVANLPDSPEARFSWWDPNTLQKTSEQGGLTVNVRQMTAAKAGGLIAAVCSDDCVRVWDKTQLDRLWIIPGGRFCPRGCEFSRDGAALAVVGLGLSEKPDASTAHLEVWIWDSASGQKIRMLDDAGIGVATSLALSPDGRYAAAGDNNGRLFLWDFASGRLLRVWQAHDRLASGIVFSPDGCLLASASWDLTARIWNVRTCELTAECRGHVRALTCLAFDPEGARLVTGSEDQTVRLWHVPTGQETLTLAAKAGFITSVRFSPNGRRLAASGSRGVIRVWER